MPSRDVFFPAIFLANNLRGKGVRGRTQINLEFIECMYAELSLIAFFYCKRFQED